MAMSKDGWTCSKHDIKWDTQKLYFLGRWRYCSNLLSMRKAKFCIIFWNVEQFSVSRFLTLCDPDPRFVLVWHSITELINSLARLQTSSFAIFFHGSHTQHIEFYDLFLQYFRSKNPKKYNFCNQLKSLTCKSQWVKSLVDQNSRKKSTWV